MELLALVPVVVLAALFAWQLAAVVGAGMAATERSRDAALRYTAPGAGVVTLQRQVAIPQLLPGTGGLSITSRAAVRIP